MATNDFLTCLDFTLKEEGGLSDSPADPGGLTNKGITLATWSRWHTSGAAGLRAITDAEAMEIYQADYWRATGCDKLPAGVDLMVFDAAVNMGGGRSVGYLEVVAGTTQDDIDGPQTETAIAAMSPTDVVERLDALQRAHYRALPTFPTFGRGWLARCDRRLVLARSLVFAASGKAGV